MLVFGIEYNVTIPQDVHTGLASGQRQHKPYVVTKQVDSASPLLGGSKPAMIRSRVDLPQPEAPIRQMNSPLAIVRLAPDSALIVWSCSLKTLSTPLISMMGSPRPCGAGDAAEAGAAEAPLQQAQEVGPLVVGDRGAAVVGVSALQVHVQAGVLRLGGGVGHERAQLALRLFHALPRREAVVHVHPRLDAHGAGRHQPSPEELNEWRGRGSSPGSGPPARLPDGRPSVALEGRCCPLQWRGRAGIAPASVSRVRSGLRLSTNLTRFAPPSQRAVWVRPHTHASGSRVESRCRCTRAST